MLAAGAPRAKLVSAPAVLAALVPIAPPVACVFFAGSVAAVDVSAFAAELPFAPKENPPALAFLSPFGAVVESIPGVEPAAVAAVVNVVALELAPVPDEGAPKVNPLPAAIAGAGADDACAPVPFAAVGAAPTLGNENPAADEPALDTGADPVVVAPDEPNEKVALDCGVGFVGAARLNEAATAG